MSSPASKDKLSELHAKLAEKLKARIESGDATAADYNVARQFLKDNDVTALEVPESDLERLGRAVAASGVKLPFEGSEGPAH